MNHAPHHPPHHADHAPAADTLAALWSDWWAVDAASEARGEAAVNPAAWQARLSACAEQPAEADAPLWRLAQAFGLPLRDALLLSLAQWHEQAGAPAVTLHDAARVLGAWRVHDAARVDQLAASSLWSRGWLLPPVAGRAWHEQTLRVPALLALALQGHDRLPPGWWQPTAATPLPASWAQRGSQVVEQLLPPAERAARGAPPCVLVLRHDERAEAWSWLRAVAAALGHRLVGRSQADVTTPAELPDAALPAWLWLTRSLWCIDALDADGRVVLPDWPGSTAPLFVLAAARTVVDAGARRVVECQLPLPELAERAALWAWCLGQLPAGRPTASPPVSPSDAAWALARRHRVGPEAIRQAAARWSHAEAGSEPRGAADLGAVHPLEPGGGLQGLARWVQPSSVAPVLPPAVRAQLDLLHARCLQRDALAAQLSPAAAARWSAGVRALLHGPSGTGKTLAAEWLAARLGKPLLVVDTAAVTSKYIGETERNLDSVMAGAERVDAVLLFDEADALFARRTDVGNSNDRYANAQTNFLLQRLEAHGGIALLTSNARSRIDAAFTRRLDAVVEFTHPAPPERLALWRALLGDAAAGVPAALLERLALDVEATGGTLRSIVATATVLAGGAPHAATLEVACALECGKTGLTAPPWAVAAHERWLQAGAPIGAPVEAPGAAMPTAREVSA